MDVTTEHSARLKEIQFEMLKTFIEICEKENLTYWLVAGTALGAVRHKGFIPWDDDIDVGMPRADYESFLKSAGKYLPEYYFLQTNETDSEYPINYAKIRDSRTTFIETSAAHLNMNHGVWIDIFPHDGYPDGGFSGKMFLALEAISKNRIIKGFKLPYAKKSAAGIVADILGWILFPSLKGALAARGRRMQKYPFQSSKRIINYNGAWKQREIMPRDVMGKGCDGEFEGLKVKLPSDYHQYLSNLYGDYMVPPPPEKQVGHHYADVIDTEKSYLEYISQK